MKAILSTVEEYSEEEYDRRKGKFYVENKQKGIEQYIVEADKAYYSIVAENERVNRIERHRLSTGLALNKLLKEYRQILN